MLSAEMRGHDWLNLHKKIGVVTLWVCALTLGSDIVWISVASHDS